MSYLRTFALVAVIGGLAWALAIGQQPGSGEAPKTSPITPRDLGAEKALTDAVNALHRSKLPWIETTVWQQLQSEGQSFQAQGIYLAGPDHQLHLLLKVQSGAAGGRLEIVCDGKTYWETMQIGTGDRRVLRKLDFQQVLAVLNEPQLPGAARAAFMQQQFFAGVVPLLQNLQKNMVFSSVERLTWQGHKVQRLSGGWSPEITKEIMARHPRQWPDNMARECRVYLDASTHWPHRFEWWGPRGRQRHTLLFEMEFRNPRFEAMTAERVAQVFHFKPAEGDQVSDQTRQVIDELRQPPR